MKKMTQVTEVWAKCSLLPDCYEVSNLGNVRKVDTDGNQIKLIKGNINSHGYLRVHIANKSFKVHRLVATSFVPNPENNPCIDHINCDKLDNRAVNLRWVTVLENNHNPVSYAKLCDVLDESRPKGYSVALIRKKSGRTIEVYDSIKEAARSLLDCDFNKAKTALYQNGCFDISDKFSLVVIK